MMALEKRVRAMDPSEREAMSAKLDATFKALAVQFLRDTEPPAK